jgi:hypothetical protein
MPVARDTAFRPTIVRPGIITGSRIVVSDAPGRVCYLTNATPLRLAEVSETTLSAAAS